MKITVDLDSTVARRIDQLARERRQTPADFLVPAANEAAHRAVLDEAIARYDLDPDNVGFSELAAETGLAVEEIRSEIWRRVRIEAAEQGKQPEEVVGATWRGDPQRAEDVFLAGCRSLAEDWGDPDLLRRAEELVATQRAERQRTPS